MHLINNVHLVLTGLRRYAYLLYQRAYIVNRIVRGRIQLVNVERAVGVEALAGLALAAGLVVVAQVLAVNGFSQNTGTGGLPYAARTAKQERVRQMAALYGVLQRGGHVLLPYYFIKPHGAVLPGRYDKLLLHAPKIVVFLEAESLVGKLCFTRCRTMLCRTPHRWFIDVTGLAAPDPRTGTGGYWKWWRKIHAFIEFLLPAYTFYL